MKNWISKLVALKGNDPATYKDVVFYSHMNGFLLGLSLGISITFLILSSL